MGLEYLKMKIFLKKAKELDSISIFQLKTSREVVRTSINKKKIKFSDHKKWFRKKINNKNCLFYTIREKNNLFVGYLRLDFENFYYRVTIAVMKNKSGKSYAFKALKKIEKIIKKNSLLFAQVLRSNKRSIRLFTKAGYKKTGYRNKIKFFTKLI